MPQASHEDAPLALSRFQRTKRWVLSEEKDAKQIPSHRDAATARRSPVEKLGAPRASSYFGPPENPGTQRVSNHQLAVGLNPGFPALEIVVPDGFDKIFARLKE